MPTITADTFLLTTEDYRRMADAGILGPEDRVELLHGQIVPMSPIGAAHLFAVNRLNECFSKHVESSEIEVSVQNPVQLGPHHEPEPGLALLRRADAPRVPTAADALLVVEVADTTYRHDSEVKLPLYAEAGVPEVWIVNLPEGRLETYRAPAGGEYTDRAILQPGDHTPLPHTTHRLRVADVLP